MNDIQSYYKALKQKSEDNIQSFSVTVDWNLDVCGQSHGRTIYGDIDTNDEHIHIESDPSNNTIRIDKIPKTKK